jgi:hypothetical protein
VLNGERRAKGTRTIIDPIAALDACAQWKLQRCPSGNGEEWRKEYVWAMCTIEIISTFPGKGEK